MKVTQSFTKNDLYLGCDSIGAHHWTKKVSEKLCLKQKIGVYQIYLELMGLTRFFSANKSIHKHVQSTSQGDMGEGTPLPAAYVYLGNFSHLD